MRQPPHRVDGVGRLVHTIHKYFIWLVIGSYVVASVMPSLGLWIRDVKLGSVSFLGGTLRISLPLLMLASLLFNAGLGVKPAELRHLLRKPMMVMLGLLGKVFVPVIFIFCLAAIGRIWYEPVEVQQVLVGLALVAAMPIAGSSTAWAQNANGNLTLSLSLVLFSTILSPIVTPLVLHAIEYATIGDYAKALQHVASGGIGTFLGVWVILPSFLGIAARYLMGEYRTASVRPVLKLINYVVLLLLNYSNASLSLPKTIAQPDFDLLIAIFVISTSLCAIAFACGFGLSQMFGADLPSRASLMFGLGMSNNGTGLVLASMMLGDHPQVMLPIIFYNLIQHMVAALVDHFMLRRAADSEDNAPSQADGPNPQIGGAATNFD
ncbi:MAG: hypothetical protein KatS3mg105_5063 [Gemmatales bacterium]|nr:MAG: hypothetical protein KatS3mg105_5063 [Gemmatales bacterium]